MPNGPQIDKIVYAQAELVSAVETIEDVGQYHFLFQVCVDLNM